MPVIRVLVMLATMVMKLAKTAKGKKVLNNVGDYSKMHPNSRLYSIIGVATITAVLMNACADDQSKKEVAEAQKEADIVRDRANKSGIELEQERQKTIKTQKDFIKDIEQNCKEEHGQFFIKKAGIKAGIGIEIEAECKISKPAKTKP